jgi:eukaryotic-like serine/threonine-protein kinase
LPSGGKFDVYRAAAAGDLGPGCYVLKMARRDTHVGGSCAMLRREALAAGEVCHRNLASVVAADWHDARPHLVRPYYDGVTLRRLLDSHGMSRSTCGPMPVSFVLGIIRQVAEALAALHAAGWLHGQVAPEHVLVSPQGHVTLVDLCEARRLESIECEAGGASAIHPVYAAPELFSSHLRITAAADAYALGVLLFEMLAGRPPFQACQREQLAACHRRQMAPDIRQRRPGESLELAELLQRILAKESLRRPGDEQLVRWLAELEIAELAL